MSEDGIKKVLKEFGLTEKETEIYIFLAKHTAMKAGEISRLTKTHRALIYRILGSLQHKGLLESSLESPTRFQVVPFETILDQSIKAKREEAAQIETKKLELLNYWKKVRNIIPEASLETFNVLEGRHRIHSKISQITGETKELLRMALTSAEFARFHQSGLFETLPPNPHNRVPCRLLIDLPSQSPSSMNAFLTETDNTSLSFEAKTPDFGLRVNPRMIIRDEEEAMFFLSQNREGQLSEKDEACLCTNSKVFVQTFKEVFEGLWKNSINLQKKTIENEMGNLGSLKPAVIDPELTWKKYEAATNSAKQSILILTSSDGLAAFSKQDKLLKDWSSKGIYLRIMAPITAENFKNAQELMQLFEVRHVPNSFSRSLTLVDDKYLFQLNRLVPIGDKSDAMPNIGITSNIEYVKRTKIMLNELWTNARVPSSVNMKSILKEATSAFSTRFNGIITPLCKMQGHKIIEEERPTEKEIVDKIMVATNPPVRASSKEFKAYLSTGQAVIHPPSRFSIPDFLLFANHFEKQSSLGEEDVLIISLWQETPNGFSYVPTAIVQDNPNATNVWKMLYDKTPAGNNVQLVKREDLQTRLHGNTFFVGWTNSISLIPPKCILPSGCIILETYGQMLTQCYTLVGPSGFRSKIEGNGFFAFVTFLSSSANYTGPGTDGYVNRDAIMTTTRD